MKTAFSIVISCVLVASEIALAAGDVYTVTPNSNSIYSQTTTTTTVTTPTSTTLYNGSNNLDSIKDAGQQAANSANQGVSMGMSAVGITGAGTAASCGSGNPSCKWWAAGLVASFAVTMNMAKARSDSVGTVGAVNSFGAPQIGTVGNDKIGSTDGTDGSLNNVPSDIANNPNWKTGIQAKQNLEKLGYKLNVRKGTVTTPGGKTISTSSLSSASAMRSAGAPESAIKELQDAFKKVESQAKSSPKGADSTDSFGDLGGGGGGKGSAALATPEFPSPTGPKLGINRDPAQVAGMKKDYNGSPIGVAGDSLFDMIDRRYQLHQQNGSFISP